MNVPDVSMEEALNNFSNLLTIDIKMLVLLSAMAAISDGTACSSSFTNGTRPGQDYASVLMNGTKTTARDCQVRVAAYRDMANLKQLVLIWHAPTVCRCAMPWCSRRVPQLSAQRVLIF